MFPIVSQNPNVNALDGVHNYELIQKFDDAIDQDMQFSLLQGQTWRTDERNKIREVENSRLPCACWLSLTFRNCFSLTSVESYCSLWSQSTRPGFRYRYHLSVVPIHTLTMYCITAIARVTLCVLRLPCFIIDWNDPFTHVSEIVKNLFCQI